MYAVQTETLFFIFASKLGIVKNFYLRKNKTQYYQRKFVPRTIQLFYEFRVLINVVQLTTTVNVIKAWLQNLMHESRILLPQGRSSLSHRLWNLVPGQPILPSPKVSKLLQPACQ